MSTAPNHLVETESRRLREALEDAFARPGSIDAPPDVVEAARDLLEAFKKIQT